MTDRKLRFCTTCQSNQPEEGGYKQAGSNRGWRCITCLKRKSTSIYSSKMTIENKRKS